MGEEGKGEVKMGEEEKVVVGSNLSEKKKQETTVSKLKEKLKETKSQKMVSVPEKTQQRAMSKTESKIQDKPIDFQNKEEEKLCIVCMNESMPIDYACVPCGHVDLCENCVKLVLKSDKKCPRCRQDVETFMKVFF